MRQTGQRGRTEGQRRQGEDRGGQTGQRGEDRRDRGDVSIYLSPQTIFQHLISKIKAEMSSSNSPGVVSHLDAVQTQLRSTRSGRAAGVQLLQLPETALTQCEDLPPTPQSQKSIVNLQYDV